MSTVLRDLNEGIKALAGDWTKYTVVGSFFLYVIGYLALRFHLTAIGVGTDLAVLDERYLFTGARFLVYLVSAVPNVVLLALPVAAVAWGVSRVLPRTFVAAVYDRVLRPRRLALFGIVFSVIVIQFVMRQCFVFSDLLLAQDLPHDPGWLATLLLDDRLMPLYFSLLVGACAVPLAVLWALHKSATPDGPGGFAKGLLAFLAAVQVLLLPVNYGILIVDKSLPRVAALGKQPLARGDVAWLVWEGKDGVTFLVKSQEPDRRSLVTVRRGDVERVEILAFDRLVPTLFGAQRRRK